MARKTHLNISSNPKDQIRLAMQAYDTPHLRAKFLFDPSRYAKKENLQLDPEWVIMIEKEVYSINKQLCKITGRYPKKI